MTSSKSKGSRVEREVAKMLGAKRSPLSGAVGGGDVWGGVFADRFCVEVKARARLATIYNWLDQAQRDIGVGDSRSPMAICKQDYGRPVAILYLEDLLSLVEDQGPESARVIRDLARDIERAAKAIRETAT